MARYKKSGRAYTYYRRGRSWANRQYYNRLADYRLSPQRRYRYARKANEAIGLYNPGMEYAAGAFVGVTEIDNAIPAPIKIVLAALPLRGGIGGKVSRFMRGVLLGDAISHYSGIKIPVGLPGTSSTSNVGWGSF